MKTKRARKRRKKKSEKDREANTRRIEKRRKTQAKRLKETNRLCSQERKCIPASAIAKLTKQLIKDSSYNKNVKYRVSKDAIKLIHTVVEEKITDLFAIANNTAHMKGMETIRMDDVRMAASVLELDPTSTGCGWKMQRKEANKLYSAMPKRSSSKYRLVFPDIKDSIAQDTKEEDWKDE